MTTYQRVSGNLVIQTLGATDQISFVGPSANAATVIIDGNLSVSGNATLTGNISGDKLFNGTSNVEIITASGNITFGVGGNSMGTFTPTGANIVGTVSASGNITGGNIITGGLITATGNVDAGNLNTTGNVIVSRDASGTGNATIRFVDTDAAVAAGQVIGVVEWYTSDGTPGARVTSAIRSIYSADTGNANVEILTSTNGAAPTTKVSVLSTGNVGVGNTAPVHLLAVQGAMWANTTITAVGNVTGGNLTTAGVMSSTGNVQAGNVRTAGQVSATGNITAGNVISLGAVSAGSAGITATGNVRGGNINSDAVVSATGNVFAGGNLLTQGYVSATGNLNAGNAIVVSNISGANISISALMSGTGIGVENIQWQQTTAVVSSAVMANVGTLTFTALANQSYKFSSNLYILPDGSTTTAFSVLFAAGTCYYTLETQATTTGAWAVASSSTSDTTGTTQSMTGTTVRTVRISGTFTHTANTDVTIRAQTSAANLNVQSGSFLTYTRIG